MGRLAFQGTAPSKPSLSPMCPVYIVAYLPGSYRPRAGFAIEPACRPMLEGEVGSLAFQSRPTSWPDGEAEARTGAEHSSSYVSTGPQPRRSQRARSSAVVAIEEKTIKSSRAA